MLDIEQRYKDLYDTYGGKSIRLVFFKDNYRALYPSETLYPSEQLYPAEMDKDAIAFEITDDMVHTDTLTIVESLCSEENLDFGACESAQMEIVVSNLDRDVAGKEFMLLQTFADFQLVRGIFTVKSTPKENDRNTRRIIAYDRMRRFDADVAGWYKTLQFPMTLKEFRDSLCDFVGVPQVNAVLVNDNEAIDKTIEPTTLNGRDVLRYICQINGVFGSINQNGELRYVTVPKKSNVVDTITRYKSAESEEYTVPSIDTVRIRKQEGDIGGVSDGGDGMNTYMIEGNFLVYGKTTSEMNQIANNVLSVISDLEYCPAVIVGNGAPWYEMGDRIKVQTSEGEINTLIMYRTSTGIQGAMDTLESTGSQELKQSFGIKSQVIEAKGLIAILNRTVEEVSNELTNFETDTTSKLSQTAERITAEVTRATETEARLSSQIAVNANNISLKVSKGDVSSQISVESGGVRIVGDRFSWESSNSSMTADGSLTCKQGTFSGKITASSGAIGGFTISGNRLVSNSNTRIQWGEFYVDGETVFIGGTRIDGDGIDMGHVGQKYASHWESDTGDIYAHEIYPTDDYSWWKGWGLFETVKELWEYVHDNI